MDFVPRFFLYGEADQGAEARFIHVETIAARSLPHDRRIAPHRHSSLLQLFLVTSGGGKIRIDAERRDFAAPSLMTLPSNLIHGFEFRPGTDGWVITLAERYAAEILSELGEAEAARELTEPLLLDLAPDPGAARRLDERLGELAQEFHREGPHHGAAIAALLRLVFITVARLRPGGSRAAPSIGAEAALFARFRALVEAWFRDHRPVGDYARALGVGEKRLGATCRRVVDRSPVEIIHARLAVEARRGLVYTSMSVAEIGYALGFHDPAYFSRFFRRQFGAAPRHLAGPGRCGPRGAERNGAAAATGKEEQSI